MTRATLNPASAADHQVDQQESAATFLQVGVDRISKATACLGFTAAQFQRMSDDLSCFLGPGGHLPADGLSEYRSGVANDGMPLEISVAWGRADTQLRFLVEPLSGSGMPASGTCAQILQWLSHKPEVSLARYTEVADIFSLTAGAAPPPLWFSGAYSKKADPIYKAYLSPGSSASESWENVGKAMRILGFGGQWACVRDCYHNMPCHPVYFSLDLSSTPASRVKVYMSHGTRDSLNSVEALGPEYRPLVDSCGDLANGWGTKRKCVQTCVSFSALAKGSPGVTLYYPLAPNLPSDAVATPRVVKIMEAEQLDSASYLSVAQALAIGPAVGSSVQSWLGIKKKAIDADATVTVYFGPETYRSHGRLRSTPASSRQTKGSH